VRLYDAVLGIVDAVLSGDRRLELGRETGARGERRLRSGVRDRTPFALGPPAFALQPVALPFLRCPLTGLPLPIATRQGPRP
jgi:hypothetical protein